MATPLTLPGVYSQTVLRGSSPITVRTDIAGFVGFEPRLSDGLTTSRLTGLPVPTGHNFRVGVLPFTIAVDGRETDVPATPDYVLSQSLLAPLLNNGDSVVFGLAIAATGALLFATPGLPSTGTPAVPTETAVAQRAATFFGPSPDYSRLADIQISRTGDVAILEVLRGSLADAVTDGSTPSHFTGGSPPSGHDFRIDIARSIASVAGQRIPLPPQTDFVLSASAVNTLLAPGQSIVFTLAAVVAPAALAHSQGIVEPQASAPSDDQLLADVTAMLGTPRQILRLANVRYLRAGLALRMTVEPTTDPAVCNDFREYIKRLGPIADDGKFLGHAARAFFANGGSRCWIATVSSPQSDDPLDWDDAREEMIGVQGASEETATGLERLLLIDQVAIIDAPDLYARKVQTLVETVVLPPAASAKCFGECNPVNLFPTTATAARSSVPRDPIYSDDDVWDAQSRMFLRVMPERWRAILLLTAPLERDPVSGEWHGPTARKMHDWRARMVGLGSEEELSAAALYHPWLLCEETVSGPVLELPATSFVAGVMARKDRARGPWVSPANETIRTAVGLAQPVDDRIQNLLYPPPENVNVIRPFPGAGLQIWGARTLSRDLYLRYLGVRRGLSAIERTAATALQSVVFEPNTMLLWIHVNQLLLQILTKMFDAGAFRGDSPEQSFYIRCDTTNNTAESIQNGLLLAEVGVALAAPQEFIVFRLGRQDGVVEVLE